MFNPRSGVQASHVAIVTLLWLVLADSLSAALVALGPRAVKHFGPAGLACCYCVIALASPGRFPVRRARGFGATSG